MPETPRLEALEKEVAELKHALAALKESEKEYRHLYDAIRDSILVADTDRRIIHCNRALTDLFGYSLDEIRGRKTAYLYQDPREFEDLGQAIKSREHEGSFLFTVHYRKKSGEVFPGETHVFYLTDDSGNVTGFMGLIRDITERVEAEERIEHLNSVLRAIRNVNQLIVRERDRAAMLSKACESLIETRGFDHAWIALFDGQRRLLSAHQAGLEDEFDALAAQMNHGRLPECVTSLLNGAELYPAMDPSKCTACPLEPGYQERRGVALRLHYGGRTFGVLALRLPPGRPLDDEETALLREVADDIAFALHALDLEEARKRSEQELRDREEELAAIYENAPLVMILVDASQKVQKINGFAVRFANRPAREMIGRRGGEALGCLNSLDHPEGCGYGPHCRECPVRLAVMDTLETGRSHHQVEATLPFALEGERTQSTFLVSTKKLELRQEPMVLASFMDITGRKRAERELAEAERRYRTLFEQIPVGLYRTTPEGRILEANPALVELLGFPDRETLLATPVDRFYVRDEDRVREHEILDRHGELRGFEAEVYRRDGTTIWVRDTADAIHEPGGAVYYEGSLLDVTDRRRAEEQRDRVETQLRHSQKLEAVGRLAGGVAHDFNNMLNVILGYADLALMRTRPGERLYQDLREIHRAAERSADLTKQLLAFSRKQIMEPKVIDLNQAVSKQLNMLRRIIGEDIEIEFSPAARLWPTRVDPSQIDQILANLSSNARDAMPEAGTVIIETSNVTLDQEYQKLHPYAEPGDYVLLTFSDTGSGIDPEILDHIFEPFFTTKTKDKGTGLGLATIYGIVKQNNGIIHAYSEPGMGTTFKIYLPRFQGQGPPRETERKEPPLGGSETVLVVEDESQVLSLAKKILERHGYTVLTASRPKEALDLVQGHPDPIHLLLTDVIMPGMNGKELKNRIQEIKPEVKVLYMSGYTARVMAQRGVLEEGIDFIQKPFSVVELANKIRTILSSDS